MRSSTTAAEYGLEETYWWFVGRRAILQRILRRLGQLSAVAIDVGCGTGRNMLLLDQHAGRVAGVDRSLAALGIAASRGCAVGCADGQRLPFADACADLVTAFDVLEHLDEDVSALVEFNRILRPDGLLLITVPAYRFLWSEHDEALMHRRRYVASELHVKLNRTGFSVLLRSYAVFFAFFPILFYRLYRGLFPKDAMSPKASHVILPSFLNVMFTWMLRLEARLMGVVRLPWGTSIVMLARKQPEPSHVPSADCSAKIRTHGDHSTEDCLVG
ncbi:MAG: class I SAM-dependent methyltransferase [Acidobacteria bacterium]|nr:class I SAM-dependent methyltransferase [Acidobacteriota bacterium]